MKISDAKNVGKKNSSGISFLFFIVVLTMVIALPLSVVWKQIAITNVSMESVKLQKQIKALDSKIVRLNITVSDASSSKRIESIASSKLGMVFPSPKEIVVIDEHRKQRGLFVSDRDKDGVITMLARSLKPGSKS